MATTLSRANKQDALIIDFYRLVSSDEWRKFSPTDPTSAHWYDDAALKVLVYHEIAHARQGGKDKPLREFVREFRGLTSTAKAKAVCAQVPEIRKLSDLDGRDDAIIRLLESMREQSAEPKPAVLGLVGEAHMRQRLEEWHDAIPDSFVYSKRLGIDHGLPFAVEVSSIMMNGGDGVRPDIGINFSPPFGDPFTAASLSCEKVQGYGIEGFLSSGHALPRQGRAAVPCAVAVHVTAPGLTFLDRAKSRVSLPAESTLRDALSDALWFAIRHIYREGERRRKDASREDRAIQQVYRGVRVSDKSAVFEVLPSAYHEATNGGTMRVSARDLYYTVRPKVLPLTGRNELGYDYFSQTLLTEYQQEFGRLEMLYYEARGVLYVPHSGQEVPLGTREVEEYDLPGWVFDKILYIEKRGVWEALKDSGLAERYDLAVISAQGYASEAARLLLSRAEAGHKCRIFVFHDADLAGYNIARTLAEETRRMPGHSIEVHDIGLKLEEALAMGLQTEPFRAQKKPPAKILARLTPVERDFFVRRHQRVEINAILPADRAGYIERKLEEAGATDKVVPPDGVLDDEAIGTYGRKIDSAVQSIVDDLLDIDEIKRQMRRAFIDVVPNDPRAAVLAAFQDDPEQSWRDAMAAHTEKEINERRDALRASVTARIADILQG